MASRKTDKDRLDELLDWYTKFKPSVKRVHVRMAEKELRFAEATNNPLEFRYRGFTLERLQERKAS